MASTFSSTEISSGMFCSSFCATQSLWARCNHDPGKRMTCCGVPLASGKVSVAVPGLGVFGQRPNQLIRPTGACTPDQNGPRCRLCFDHRVGTPPATPTAPIVDDRLVWTFAVILIGAAELILRVIQKHARMHPLHQVVAHLILMHPRQVDGRIVIDIHLTAFGAERIFIAVKPHCTVRGIIRKATPMLPSSCGSIHVSGM